MRPSLEHLEGKYHNASCVALSVKQCGRPAKRPSCVGLIFFSPDLG